MMDSGEMEWPKGTVFSTMQMEIYMRVSSDKTEPMDMELTLILTDRDMRATGRMTCKRVTVKRCLKMVATMKASSNKERSGVSVPTPGQTSQFILGNGLTIT